MQTCLEKACKEENAHQRKVAGGRDGVSSYRRRDPDIKSNVKHCTPLSNAGPEERASTTETVSGEQQETRASRHLDNAVDASSKETSVGRSDTQSLEDLRSIVIDYTV